MNRLVEEYFNSLPSELDCTNVVSHNIEIERTQSRETSELFCVFKILECIDAELDIMPSNSGFQHLNYFIVVALTFERYLELLLK